MTQLIGFVRCSIKTRMLGTLHTGLETFHSLGPLATFSEFRTGEDLESDCPAA